MECVCGSEMECVCGSEMECVCGSEMECVCGSEMWLIQLQKVFTHTAASGNIISCLLTYSLHASQSFWRS